MLNSVERALAASACRKNSTCRFYAGRHCFCAQYHKAVLLKPAGPDREPEPSHFSR